MVQFKYTVSRKGQESSGVVEADNLAEAAEKLGEKGGYILELKQRFSWGSVKIERGLEKLLVPLTERMSGGEKILFTTQMGAMLKAGLPITSAIEVFVDEQQSKGTSVALKRIMGQLEAGKSLAEALASYPKVFDKIYVSVVKAGETMGKLAESLGYLGEQLKRDHDLKSRIRSAMIYPIVVLTAMIGVMSFIVFSVVPKIIVFAQTSGAELPQITKIMVAGVEFASQWWGLMLLGVLGLGVGWWRLGRTEKGKRLIGGMWLRVPVISNLVRRYNQARFARLLSGFYRYGISVELAFEILAETLSSYHYTEACLRMKSKLVLGKSLSSVLSAERELFSPIMSRVVKGAEHTGVVDETLLKLAEYYEEELETALNDLTTIIEPIMIVFLGMGVIGIALSVILPIYRVTSQLK